MTDSGGFKSDAERFKRKYQREKAAREAAEGIAERTTRELYLKNRSLEEQQGMIRALLEQAEDAFYVLDRDFTILDVNARACESMLYERDDYRNMDFAVIQRSLDTGSKSHLLNKLLKGERVRAEDSHVKRTGDETPVRLSFELFHGEKREFILCHAQDLSEVKEIQREARRQEVRARTIVSSLAEGLLLLSEDGEISYSNPSATRLFGYSEHGLDSLSVLDVLPECTLENIDQWTIRNTDEYQGEATETRALLKSGESIPVEITIIELGSSTSEERVLLIRDIRERKRIERMKDNFVATVSHELRTPVASIRGSLGLLLSGAFGDFPSEVVDVLELSERNSIRLINIINDLLDYQQLQGGELQLEPSSFPIIQALEDAVGAVRSFAREEGVEILFEDCADHVYADSHRVTQIVINFLSNAAKFSKPGQDVRAKCLPLDGILRVEVADKGRGIPEAALEEIFSPFKQVEPADTREKGGTGLGLAICRDLVHRMGGEIGVQSTEGEGSTFWFTLPTSVEHFERRTP